VWIAVTHIVNGSAPSITTFPSG
ncbi:putative glutamate synthase subunit beta, partial [Vibrio parahaemolyticus VPTS-2010_2]